MKAVCTHPKLGHPPARDGDVITRMWYDEKGVTRTFKLEFPALMAEQQAIKKSSIYTRTGDQGTIIIIITNKITKRIKINTN